MHCDTGEVCEEVNATMAPHGLTTQYMRGTNREAHLERMVLLHEREQDAKVAAQQVDKLLRVAARMPAVAKELDEAVTCLKQLLTGAGQVSILLLCMSCLCQGASMSSDLCCLYV
jgi:hypothetical protein